MFCSGLAKRWLWGVLNLQFIHCIAQYITLYARFSCLKGLSNACFVISGMRAEFTQLETKKSHLKPLDEEGRRTKESRKRGEERKKEAKEESKKYQPRPVVRLVVHRQDRSSDRSNYTQKKIMLQKTTGPFTTGCATSHPLLRPVVRPVLAIKF